MLKNINCSELYISCNLDVLLQTMGITDRSVFCEENSVELKVTSVFCTNGRMVVTKRDQESFIPNFLMQYLMEQGCQMLDNHPEVGEAEVRCSKHTLLITRHDSSASNTIRFLRKTGVVEYIRVRKIHPYWRVNICWFHE